MHLVLRRDLLDRPVAPQCFQRNLRLEIGRKPASCRYLKFLRYPVEYTLTTCPIFRDHLKKQCLLLTKIRYRTKQNPGAGVVQW